MLILKILLVGFIKLEKQPNQTGFEACGIPVVELKPSQLSESALVSQAIKTALKGAAVVLDEIMATPLLTLPKWWGSIKL